MPFIPFFKNGEIININKPSPTPSPMSVNHSSLYLSSCSNTPNVLNLEYDDRSVICATIIVARAGHLTCSVNRQIWYTLRLFQNQYQKSSATFSTYYSRISCPTQISTRHHRSTLYYFINICL